MMPRLSAVPGTLLICALLVGDVSSFSSPASPLLGTRRVASSSSSRWVIPSRASSARRAPFLRMQPAGLADAPQPPAQDAWTAAALYACPQCGSGISLDDVSCPSCGAPISTNEGFTDLTPDATAPVAPAVEATDAQRFLDDLRKNPLVSAALSGGGLPLPGQPLRQELFRTPVLSFLYERGWRDGFKQAGFPGIEKEFEMAMEFFQVAREGNGTVIDLSCGSGLMVRRLAKSQQFGKVIAVDFSENMLKEVIRRSEEEKVPTFDLVRADVAKMPFGTASVDAIHAGAALHCWPSVQDGLKEVHRTLKPGGTFFATTFLWGVDDRVVNLGQNLPGSTEEAVRRLLMGRSYRYYKRQELEWLMKSAGFSEVTVDTIQRCAIIKCKK